MLRVYKYLCQWHIQYTAPNGLASSSLPVPRKSPTRFRFRVHHFRLVPSCLSSFSRTAAFYAKMWLSPFLFRETEIFFAFGSGRADLIDTRVGYRDFVTITHT